MLSLCGVILWFYYANRSSGNEPSDAVVLYCIAIAYSLSVCLLLAGCIALYRLRLMVERESLPKSDLLLTVATIALVVPWLLIEALAAQLS